MEKGTKVCGNRYPEEKDIKIGDRIAKARKNYRKPDGSIGLTRAELAEMINCIQEDGIKKRSCSEKQVGYWETGSRALSETYATLVAKALGVKREYLLLESDEPTDMVYIKVPGLDDAKKYISVIGMLEKNGIIIEQVLGSGIKVSCKDGFLSINYPVEVTINGKCILSTYQDVEKTLIEIFDYALFKIGRLSGG